MDRSSFDRPGTRSSSYGASVAHGQPAVGKTTLVDPSGIPAASAGAGAVQRKAAGEARQDAEVHAAAAHGVATASGSLPHADRIQQLFGRHGISSVQAHIGSEATASAQAMGAEAYAAGNHVVLGGRSDLHTAAHEAAHVVQQRSGVQLAGGVGQVGDRYERHADEVADAVVQGRSVESLLDRFAVAGSTSGHDGGAGAFGTPAVQRLKWKRNADAGTQIATETDKYFLHATSDNDFLYAAAGAAAPKYCVNDGTVGTVTRYKPAAKFFSDCLRAAEEVMHGKKLRAGSVKSQEKTSHTAFGNSEADNWSAASNATVTNQHVKPRVGEGLAIVEDAPIDLGNDVVCQYHAAAVVAMDGDDLITLEIFGDPDTGKRTADAKFSIYVAKPYSKYNFHHIWSTVFGDGITIGLIKK